MTVASTATVVPTTAAVEVSPIQAELMTPGPGRVPVDFAIDAPDAQEVTLEMIANFWADDPRQTIELFRVDDDRGSHAVTLYLGNDQWEYRFRLDGVPTPDPANPLRVADADGQENSILVVGETLPWLSEQPDVATGAVREHVLPAGVLGEEQTVVVYTPPGYTDQQRYPLLVLLHGFGMRASSWVEVAGIDHAMDNLIAAGEIDPFVVAMPNTAWTEYTDAYPEHLLDEVMPYLDANYSLDPGTGSTAIAGFSMGGHGTLQLAYLRPERFGLAMPIAMAAPWCGRSCDDVDQFASQYPEGFDADIAMWTGANDELGMGANHEIFAAYLDERGHSYDHHVDTSDGHFQDGHSMRYVRTVLPDVLRRAAQHFTS
jgi:enterochelin esterase-like enzyme